MLSRQIDVLGLDTADFYSNREKYLHNLNHRVRAEKNALMNGGTIYRCHGRRKVQLRGLRQIEGELVDDYGFSQEDLSSAMSGSYETDDDALTALLSRCRELRKLIDIKNRKAKETKDELLTILENKVESNNVSNGSHHIRTLRNDAIRDDKIISVFDSYFTRTIGAAPGEFTDDFMIVKVFYFDVLKDILFNGFMHEEVRVRQGVNLESSSEDHNVRAYGGRHQ